MSDRAWKQTVVGDWAIRCFGEDEALSIPQRGIRLLEEAIEAAQACDVDEEKAVSLIRYVYSRPKGTIAQEMGGVAVTLMALGYANNTSVEFCEECEILRILNKPVDHFRKRNQFKNDAGFKVTEE